MDSNLSLFDGATQVFLTPSFGMEKAVIKSCYGYTFGTELHLNQRSSIWNSKNLYFYAFLLCFSSAGELMRNANGYYFISAWIENILMTILHSR